MAEPILVTGAAGRVGAVGRTVTELLLKQLRRFSDRQATTFPVRPAVQDAVVNLVEGFV